MPYLRHSLTISLSILWFMGAIPAPADANPLSHLFKKAAHVVVHTAIHTVSHAGKEAVTLRSAGPLAKAVLHAPAPAAVVATTARRLSR